MMGSQVDPLSLFCLSHPIIPDMMESSLSAPHTDASRYWASYLAESEPCQFPRLGAGIDGSKRAMSIRVNLEHLQRLQQLAVSEEAALPSLLRVAWGLLLRCYTGLDDVCFGYQEPGTGTAGNERPRISASINGMPAARFTVDGMVSVADALERVKGEYISGLPHQNSAPSSTTKDSWWSEHQLFDTAVVLRRSSNATASKNTIVTSQPLNEALSQEVCTRASPKHPYCLFSRSDTNYSARYACLSSISMENSPFSWNGGAFICPWSKPRTLPAHLIEYSASSCSVLRPPSRNWTASVSATSCRSLNGTAAPWRRLNDASMR
jgi:hypothetical protein